MLQMLFLLPAKAGDKHLPGGLVSTQTGVICNEKEKVCYDIYGVSLGITKDIMGQQAADTLLSEIRDVPENHFDRTNFNPAPGFSCHVFEKVCYEGDTRSEELTSALFGNSVGKYDSHALFDVPWDWVGSRYNNDTEVLAADGREYRLTFQADGSLKIQADCNRVSGRYRSKKRSISIILGPSTLMACEPGSRDQQFLRDLQGAALWFLKKGELYIDIKSDTGTMRFSRGAAQ